MRTNVKIYLQLYNFNKNYCSKDKKPMFRMLYIVSRVMALLRYSLIQVHAKYLSFEFLGTV